MIDTTITDADLLAEYQRSGLAARGMGFAAAIANPTLRKTIENGIKAQRRRAADRAKCAPSNYQLPKEEAA